MTGVFDAGLMASGQMQQAQHARGALSDTVNAAPSFMWLEITGKCQLECVHCYADSSPRGNHGTMTVEDWKRVIEEGAEVGVKTVQFIGGEPTLYPGLPELIDYSLNRGIAVEVYSNLVSMRPTLWDKLGQAGVRLATSYYSSHSDQHDGITRRKGSHDKTRANILEALSRGIPLRVGIVGIESEQDVASAKAELVALGVPEDSIGIDYLREVGRGMRHGPTDASQLCGRCATNVVAVRPDGTVNPCVFSRWLSGGNVREESLANIVVGGLKTQQKLLNEQFESLRERNATCSPICDPINCQPHCQPMVPPCPPQGCPPLDVYCPPNYPGPPPSCPPFGGS